MANIHDTNQYYEPSSQIAIEPCAEFVPNLMYDFMMWLTNDNAYRNISNCAEQNIAKNNLGAISIVMVSLPSLDMSTHP
jgi:hypothetical protein